MQSQDGVKRDDLLWLLASLCALYRIPFDPALLAQDYPPPYRVDTLHEAARSLGIKTGDCPITRIDWQSFPYPIIAFEAAIAELTDANVAGEDEAGAAEPPLGVLLIVKATADELVYFRPGEQSPETMPISEAAARLAPDLILVAREAATGTGSDETIAGFPKEKKAFGFSWFIPELLKHKSLWRDVLLASLAIQVVGLSTPVITQVIIDKVVVHQTNSTLKLAQEVAKQAHRQQLLELRATQDSVVKDLATHTVGTVVQPGTVLLTLVPKEETLKAEVWVSNDDIGFVRQGQPVKLKLAAFPFQKYGMIEGVVEHVSADSADGNTGNGTAPNDKTVARKEPLVYKALIGLKAMALEMDGERFVLGTGMQANAEIWLGTRTVMEFLLSPVRKAWHEAGRER